MDKRATIKLVAFATILNAVPAGVKPERGFQPHIIGGALGLRPIRDEPEG